MREKINFDTKAEYLSAVFGVEFDKASSKLKTAWERNNTAIESLAEIWNSDDVTDREAVFAVLMLGRALGHQESSADSLSSLARMLVSVVEEEAVPEISPPGVVH